MLYRVANETHRVLVAAICRRNLNTGEEEYTLEITEDNEHEILMDDTITVPNGIMQDKEALYNYITGKSSTMEMISFLDTQDNESILDDLEVSQPRILPYYQASTTCSATGYATAPVSYTYYYYAGVNYYYYACCPSGGIVSGSSCYYYYSATCSSYYCCPSGGTVSGASCYYYYGATPVTYGQYECRAGGSLQTDGVTCLRNNC